MLKNLETTFFKRGKAKIENQKELGII